jgi:CTP:molybdopterin cytidylyltransferase MocA
LEQRRPRLQQILWLAGQVAPPIVFRAATTLTIPRLSGDSGMTSGRRDCCALLTYLGQTGGPSPGNG